MCLALGVAGFTAAPGFAATPTVTEFSIEDTDPIGITAGPDGNLWFTGFNSIGRITPAGVATKFNGNGFSSGAKPSDIAAGPDGNLWFTELDGNRIGRITPAGTVTEFSAGISAGSQPRDIVAGPDGNLWFTELAGNRIGRINPAGTVTEFGAGISAAANLNDIAAGPDGNLWFTELDGNRIGRITPAGTVTEFSAGISAGARPFGITPGPDGNLWFTEFNANRIGKIDPATGTVTEFSAGVSRDAGPANITAGPDGNLWFTEFDGNRIGRITPGGSVAEFKAGISFADSGLRSITAGPDGNLWFTEFGSADRIGRINTELDPPAFSNQVPIAIPATGTSGPASPYPSEIPVSGLQGKTTDVRVRLTGLAHTHPDDVEFLLQAPSGQTALLMSDAGGTVTVPAATLTFSDASAFLLPNNGPVVSGFFGPSGNDTTSFPAPAPQPPYGTALSALDGIDPNGTWKLFVNDDANGDAGVLRGGWGLDIDTNRSPLDLTLQAKPKQKVGKLKVKATCSSACDLSASAAGKAAGEKFKSKPAEADGAEDTAEKLKLTLAKRALKKVQGEKGKATITVTATSPGGGTDSATAKVKLK